MIGPVVDALLPPTILAVLALALLIAGRRLYAGLALGGLILLCTVGGAHVLVQSLLPQPPAPPDAAPGAIVVQASAMPELLDASRSTPSLGTLERLRAAAALFRRTGAPILVSGARAPDGPVSLAAQMALSLADDFGVTARWAETGSTNLWQSAAASAAILQQAGIRDVYLVAEPWELRLSLEVFRAAGLAVTPAPIPHAKLRAIGLTGLVLGAPAMLDSAMAFRQWAGLACQALTPCVDWMRGRL